LSHQQERKDKDCLNCGTLVHGRFCHVCGQENLVPHQSFGHLVKHFIYDLFHFDGKFFDTLRNLLFRPGYVPAHYIQGKRMRYLDPIRMYLFTSAVFFLVFFAAGNSRNLLNLDRATQQLTEEDRREMIAEYRGYLAEKPGDTSLQRKLNILLDTTQPLTVEQLYQINDGDFINLGEGNYRSLAEYDSVQKTLAPGARDGWLRRMIARKGIAANEKYRGNWKGGTDQLTNVFLHNLPYLLFLSLPFFALILRLLYIRRRQFFYADHIIFSLYHYIFSFMLLLTAFGLAGLSDWTGWKFFKYMVVLLFIAGPVYLFLSMKIFYRQGIGKTLLKSVVLLTLAFAVLVVLLILFFLLSIFQI
jgi:hypothetical protein